MPKGGDSEKFARECLDLLHLLRQEKPDIDPEDEEELKETEGVAKALIEGLKKEKEREKSQPKNDRATEPLAEDEEIIWQSEPPTAEEIAEVLKNAAKVSKIEGYLRDKHHVPMPEDPSSS